MRYSKNNIGKHANDGVVFFCPPYSWQQPTGPARRKQQQQQKRLSQCQRTVTEFNNDMPTSDKRICIQTNKHICMYVCWNMCAYL